MSLTISTVIPAYNSAEHLGQAIESVLRQSRSSSEIIVVDDCSTDTTTNVVRSFADSRITLLSTSTNSGSATARNIGIHAARGDLVAMLDADDEWLDNHLEVVAGLLEQHSTAALAFSPTQAFGAEHWVWPIRIPTDEPVKCFWECVPRTIVPHMNVVVRRDALMNIGGYRPELRQCQDYDLFLRMSYRHSFVCTTQVTSRYRRHPGSITMRQPFNAIHCMYRSRAMFSQELARTTSGQDVERYTRKCLDLWHGALQACVSRRNWRLMDCHLSQASYVPGSETTLLRWKLRRAAGTLQWIWDVANRPLRRAS